VGPEELRQLKIPVTPSRIKPATFQFVAQCLNGLQHHMLPFGGMIQTGKLKYLG
jgi:hypothetical protein